MWPEAVLLHSILHKRSYLSEPIAGYAIEAAHSGPEWRPF